MKPAGLLTISLALNLALGIVWFVASSRTAPLATVPAAKPSAPAPVAATVLSTAAPPVEVGSPLAGKFDWSGLEPADFRQYTANLRNVHCPERLVRDIVVAAIEKNYDDRRAELNNAPMQFEPWVGADTRVATGQKRSAQGKALGLEEAALIKELFGVDWNREISNVRQEEVIGSFLLGFLPDDKSMQTIAVAMNCDERARDIRSAAEGILIPEDLAQLRKVADEQMARLGELLTPVELDELRHRIQLFAMDHGDVHFDGVTLSGTEMRKIAGFTFGLNDFLRDQLIVQDDISEEEKTNRRAVFDQQVAGLLDPQRYADYQLAQDRYFRDAYRFASQHHLAKAAAIKVADAVHSADAQAQEIREDQALSAAEKKLALQVLQTTVHDQLSGVLGASLDDYEKNNGAGLRYVPPEKSKEGAR